VIPYGTQSPVVVWVLLAQTAMLLYLYLLKNVYSVAGLCINAIKPLHLCMYFLAGELASENITD